MDRAEELRYVQPSVWPPSHRGRLGHGERRAVEGEVLRSGRWIIRRDRKIVEGVGERGRAIPVGRIDATEASCAYRRVDPGRVEAEELRRSCERPDLELRAPVDPVVGLDLTIVRRGT